jgi:two-component system invasion response regulator UvrY
MIKVLLVDDHRLVREGIRSLLEETAPAEKIEVIGSASTGEEAMQLMEKDTPDIVLLDLKLPGLPGDEVMRHLLALYPKIKVIILTATTSGPIAKKILGDGASGFVSKDSGLPEVIKAIHAVMEGERYVSSEVAQQLALSNLGGQDQVIEQLSSRELQILQLIADGLKNQQIAERLSLSPKTISTYKKRMTAKLHAKSTVELLRIAIQYGLVDVGSR